MQLIVLCVLLMSGAIYSKSAGALESYTVPLCCPVKDWRLARLSRGLFRADDFTCIPPSLKDNGPTLHDAKLQPFENSSAAFGYGVLTAEDRHINSSIPNCHSKTFRQYTLGEDIGIPQLSCLMAIDDQHVATVSCPPTFNVDLQPVRFIHKCCPVDGFYDGIQRKCIKGSANYFLYKQLFDDVAIFNANPLNCPRDKVMVEYQLNSLKFNINGGLLFLKSSNKKFAFMEFCIEAVVQDVLDANFSRSSNELKREQQFLIRTCDSILPACRQMPCIRRCCNDGEILVKENSTTVCKRDEYDTAYHSFESLDITGNFTKPPDGTSHHVRCRQSPNVVQLLRRNRPACGCHLWDNQKDLKIADFCS